MESGSSAYRRYEESDRILIKEVLLTAGLNSVAFEKDINPLDLLKAYYIKKETK